MNRPLFAFAFLITSFLSCAQGRNLNKMTLETTYSYTEISQKIRDVVDLQKRENYFNDNFFNSMLKQIVQDKQFSPKQKVQLFYLMQKKIGYAFVGLNYLPPKQNYFIFYQSEIQVLQQTTEKLQPLNMDPGIYLQMADSHQTKDPIIAANALLLATLLNQSVSLVKLRKLSNATNILQSKNPAIFNHYVCLSAALTQDSVVSANLKKNIFTFKQENMIEDAICALYARPFQLATIKEYILQEKNQLNDLSIETALCALQTKIPETSFSKNIKSISAAAKEPWKKELLDKIADGKMPYSYGLSNEEQLVPKPWDGVQISIYNDGTLISNNTLLEFDPN